MKRVIACAIAIVMLWQGVRADEGMWLINTIGKTVYPQMKAKGLKLKDKAIFNESSPALYDAIVAVDGGMGTGSMISDEGLMITNHHVAFSDICALSTPEQNYLETGFWAKKRADELPVKDKTVWFLRKIVDITAEANQLKAEMVAAGKWGSMSSRRLYADLESRYKKDTSLEVWCVPMWGGQMYFMMYYEIYTDVRLVGAPPISIGAFGGDVDNWSWPQHKGDFTLYRVYGDENGRPAKYSADNTPIKPRKYLSISAAGVQNNDYAMVIGFPGRTNRYASSSAVEEKQKIRNPIVVKNRHDRMEIINRNMQRSADVRMKYSDAYFGLSNYADYAKWETKCLRRFNVVDIRAKEEMQLRHWIDADSTRKVEYGNMLDDIKRGYDAHKAAMRDLVYFQESWFGQSDAMLMATRLSSYVNKLVRQKNDTLYVESPDCRSVLEAVSRLEDNYDQRTDRELFIKMAMNFTDSVPRKIWGTALNKAYDAFGGDVGRMAGEAFDNSICSDYNRYKDFFLKNQAVADIRRDPLLALIESVDIIGIKKSVDTAEQEVGIDDMNHLEASYVKALYDFRSQMGVPQYPNANSTMRLTYGTVGAIHPCDGVFYDSRSTIQGYVEKYDPDAYEFRVDERMRSLIAAKDWGRWGDKGKMYVNFITNNDITGGNSGSPVLDSKGHIIGLAFDGNRESMAGDVYFHPEMAKTVCVDIRYVMWIIDKYANSDYLIDEMKIIK